MTSTGAAHVELAGRTSRVGTGVAVLDHLLEELAEAGAFGLTLEIAPDAPEAEVGRAGAALGDAFEPLFESSGGPVRGFGIAP